MEIKIVHQGKPIVNGDTAHIKAESDDIIAAEIDMKSKHCDILFHSTDDEHNPVIAIIPTEHSLFLDDQKEGATEVSMLGYKKWDIFTSEIVRYTLRVCLIKRK